MNERYMDWDDVATQRLVIKIASERLEIPPPQVMARMSALAALIPQLGNRFETIMMDVLVDLIRDPDHTAEIIVTLALMLPGADVEKIVTTNPRIVTQLTVGELQRRIAVLEDLAENSSATLTGPLKDVGRLCSREPRILNVDDLSRVLADVERLIPKKNPVDTFFGNPGVFLNMEDQGMYSSAERGSDYD